MHVAHLWGDCVKPGKYSLDSQGTKTLGAFTWADKSCDDFEPIADQPAQDFL